MTTTTERIGMIIHPAEEPKSKPSAKVATPKFATRADQEAYHRAKYYERLKVPNPDASDTSNPTAADVPRGNAARPQNSYEINLELSPGMAKALVLFYRFASAIFRLCKFVWFLFALATATVIAGMILGALSV